METKLKLRDFTSYSKSDLKAAIKWHKEQLRFWSVCLGDAIFYGLDSSHSLERVSYHSACISKARSILKFYKFKVFRFN